MFISCKNDVTPSNVNITRMYVIDDDCHENSNWKPNDVTLVRAVICQPINY